MSRNSISLVAAIGLAILLLCGTSIGLPLLYFGEAQANPCGNGIIAPNVVAPSGTTEGFDRWNGTQVARAAAIVVAGQNKGIPPRGWVIALAVAMQESGLRNLANDNPAYPLVRDHSQALPHDGVGHDHDSVGLFQQRPKPPEGAGGWGTVAELMTPAKSADKFYGALNKIEGWERMRLTEAAQAIQRSAFPDAYQKWEQPAEGLAAHLLGLPDLGLIGGAATAPCGPDGFGPVPIGPGGWVQPVQATIWSGFRPPARPTHYGVDLGASRGTAIRVASSGYVVKALCDPGTISTVGSCDRDGSPSASGCGWYVDVWHPGDVVTRYCHMVQRPYVTAGQRVDAGQVLGLVGSSGNSSGPHLHYEVHVGVPRGNRAFGGNAIDPVPWHIAVQAPLGDPR